MKKFFRILLLLILAAAVLGTFYFYGKNRVRSKKNM